MFVYSSASDCFDKESRYVPITHIPNQPQNYEYRNSAYNSSTVTVHLYNAVLSCRAIKSANFTYTYPSFASKENIAPGQKIEQQWRKVIEKTWAKEDWTCFKVKLETFIIKFTDFNYN